MDSNFDLEFFNYRFYKIFMITIVSIAAIFAIYLFKLFFSHLGVNTTDSVKFRLYYIKKNKNYEVDNYIMFVATKQYPYPFLKKGDKAVKRVACTEGDILDVADGKYLCNSKPISEYKIIKSKYYGDIVPILYKNYKIPKGFLFVVGDNPRSYDSRFWGLLNEKDIVSVVLPIM